MAAVTPLRRASIIVFGALCLWTFTATAQSTRSAPEKRSWMVRLVGSPVATLARNGEPADAQRAHHQLLRARQQPVIEAFEAAGLPVIYRFTRLEYALQVLGTEAQVHRVAGSPALLDRVRDISKVTILHPTMDDSAKHIGATTAWELYGLQGQGVTIGIVDSGVDYLHASFEGVAEDAAYEANDGTTIEDLYGEGEDAKLMFPTPAVVGGWDFTGYGYEPGMEPAPDPDPMPDANDNGWYADHGSHVGGIAAGRAAGVIDNGIAPAASVYALKVSSFTSTDLMPAAVEWSSDPNQDGDLSDRIDVLNISLGSAFAGLPSNGTLAEQAVIENYISIGGLIAASAGNEGDNPFIHSSPASVDRVMAVANSNGGGETEGRVEVTSPPELSDIHAAIEANFEFTAKLEDTGPISGPLIHIGKACEGDAVPDLTGAIALIERTDCSNGLKLSNAAEKGAVAAVFVHHKESTPNKMNSSPYSSIPAVQVWNNVGTALIDAMQGGAQITVTLTSVEKEGVTDTIWGSSSRGPAHNPTGLTAKPDIIAPGVNIGSVQAGGPTNAKNASGTSMSSPHVAGVLALVRQAHPDWSEADIRAALMNTAQPVIMQGENIATYTRQGAGLVDVVAAVTTDLLVSGGPNITLDLGVVVVDTETALTRSIRVSNHADTTRDVALTVDIAPDSGWSIELPASVTVPANDTLDVDVTITFSPDKLPAWPLRNTRPDQWVLNERDLVTSIEREARIVLKAADGATASLPVWAMPKRGAVISVEPTDCAPLPGSPVTLEATGQGRTEVYTLIARDEVDPDIPAHADLTAIGARLRSVEGETHLEFAFVTEGKRVMPDEFMVAMWVDWTGDGVADAVVSHFDEGYVDGEYPNGKEYALLLSLQDLVGDGVADVGLPAGFFDVIAKGFAYADLESRRLVLPIPIAALGTVPSQISMWALTWDRYGMVSGTTSAVDSAPNVGALLNPATSPARFTLNLDCGLWTGETNVAVDGTATLDGLTPPECNAAGLLLLHDSGAEHEVTILDADSYDLSAECPSEVEIEAPADACTARLEPEPPAPETECKAPYTITPKDDLDWPVGQHQTVLDLADPWGASESCEILLTVVDRTAPELNLSAAEVDGQRATWTVTASDGCGVASVRATANCEPECSVVASAAEVTVTNGPAGEQTTVTVTAVDAADNETVVTGSATFTAPTGETDGSDASDANDGVDDSDGVQRPPTVNAEDSDSGCTSVPNTPPGPWPVALLMLGAVLLYFRRAGA